MISPTTETTNEVKCFNFRPLMMKFVWAGLFCWSETGPCNPRDNEINVQNTLPSWTRAYWTYDLALPRDRTKLFASYFTDFHHPVIVPASEWSNDWLPNEYHIHVWQMSAQRPPSHTPFDVERIIVVLPVSWQQNSTNIICISILILNDYQYSSKQLWFKIMIII